jgi:phosphatidylglycerophosphate synthase
MSANAITLSRFPLLLAWVLGLYLGSPPLRLAGVALLFLGLMLDTVDGIVARRTGQTSLLGSVLDVAADRTYELVVWVCLADLDLVPAAIPLLVLARTTLTDAFRSVWVAWGTPPLRQARGAWARFLTESSIARSGYAATKIAAFCGLALAHAVESPTLATAMQPIAWAAVALCLGRGIPVLLTGLPQTRTPAANSTRAIV